MVLFCSVVLPGFPYLVIFLSLFSLIIILITCSLIIYSLVPHLVQYLYPCISRFFVLSHVILSGYFSGFIKRLCLISASFVFLPKQPVTGDRTKRMTAEDKLLTLRQVGRRLEQYVEDLIVFAGPTPLLVRAFSWG